ncbi:hypothetical protein [Enterobacter sp.]|uniref:hypothetical protein n=1 Tax=Enterobacter sp. TaxID=42895 RepID=UPI00296F20BB|nr:hypothetical protein [Enterobacter sp.]
MEYIKYTPYVTMKIYDGTNAEGIVEFAGQPFSIVDDLLVYDSAGYIPVEVGSVITNTAMIFESEAAFLTFYTATK